MAIKDEYTRKLGQNHVISYQSPSQGSEPAIWAGYSPSNGLFWVGGENFVSASLAAEAMIRMRGVWNEIDQCIDEE